MKISESLTLSKYKETMIQILKLYMPWISDEELNPMIDYSIKKRFKNSNCVLNNTYTNHQEQTTLLAMADYIASREPIVTAQGTLFMKHADCPNPMSDVIQLFLELRGIHKKEMFQFPKGSEDFEKYNLLQSLDKIDANGCYGCIGMYSCLLFNVNVSSSVTSQGRALISSASMFFESFLSNSVKFGSIDEVLEFINHVLKEDRKYFVIDNPISIENCFAKIIDSCGYRWYPNEEEMDIIWRVLCNLGQEDLNRIYYKNNLYEFMNNSYMVGLIKKIMTTISTPYLAPLEPPEEIIEDMDLLADILREYVFYDKMYIDRIDRCDNMMKSCIMISDTDSCIVSFDAWYRFILPLIQDEVLHILRTDPVTPFTFYKTDEFGDPEDKSQFSPFIFESADEHFDFVEDEIIYEEHAMNPFIILPQDQLRWSIINILSYVIDKLLNAYMLHFTKNNHSFANNRKCKIIMKNEFSMTRALLTGVKKSYASVVQVQEGNLIPEEEQLDIKGIASMAKSSMSTSTRNAFKKILLEDILTADPIDQFKVIEKLAILEKKITTSILDGSKEYYKPVTIKAMSDYEDPMKIQGIKASHVWNELKPEGVDGIDLTERNAISIAKIKINKKNIESLKETNSEIYEKAKVLLEDNMFKGKIESIAMPLDVDPPEWLLDIIDYNTILNDNMKGFVYDSIGLVNLDPNGNNTNFSNILQL